MSVFKEASETEMEIMEVLWDEGSAKTFAWLLDYFNSQQGKQWKRQTLSTYLLRLAEKGVVFSKNVGRTSEYSPMITRNEYESAKVNFMTALYDGKSVPIDEMSELKQ